MNNDDPSAIVESKIFAIIDESFIYFPQKQ